MCSSVKFEISLVETMCSSGKFEISGGDHVFIREV